MSKAKPPFEKGETAYFCYRINRIYECVVKFCRKWRGVERYDVFITLTVDGETFSRYVSEYSIFHSKQDALLHQLKANQQELDYHAEKIEKLKNAQRELLNSNK